LKVKKKDHPSTLDAFSRKFYFTLLLHVHKNIQDSFLANSTAHFGIVSKSMQMLQLCNSQNTFSSSQHRNLRHYSRVITSSGNSHGLSFT